MEPKFDLKGKKVWVAGETGLVGGAVIERLSQEDCEILSAPHRKLDLTQQTQTENWIEKNKPDVIILAAARVGGIGANKDFPADFIYDNVAIAQNVIHAAHTNKVEKLLYLGSSCIYPKMAEQPIAEDSLLTSELEKTNQWYAIAKIAGLKLCQAYRRQHGCDFIAAMPTNLYGPGDSFDEYTSHVVPALMLRMHKAKEMKAPSVPIWGSGKPLREFLYIDDLADALICILKNHSKTEPVNVGSGREISIADLAALIKEVVGYQGELEFDTTKPDGTPRKLLDSSQLSKLGWRAETELEQGLKQTYRWFRENQKKKAA